MCFDMRNIYAKIQKLSEMAKFFLTFPDAISSRAERVKCAKFLDRCKRFQKKLVNNTKREFMADGIGLFAGAGSWITSFVVISR